MPAARRRYSSSLSKRCTHLICDTAEPATDKLSTGLAYQEAWGLEIVRSGWVHDSCVARRRLPEANYRLMAPPKVGRGRCTASCGPPHAASTTLGLACRLHCPFAAGPPR